MKQLLKCLKKAVKVFFLLIYYIQSMIYILWARNVGEKEKQKNKKLIKFNDSYLKVRTRIQYY